MTFECDKVENSSKRHNVKCLLIQLEQKVKINVEITKWREKDTFTITVGI